MRPSCTILAGPNGAGKSTIYKNLTLPGRFINADEVARSLAPANPQSQALAAGRHVVAAVDRVLQDRADFVYETTLASRQSIRVVSRAKELGYEILLVFVILITADLHVQRVAQRVSRGGHHIPETLIRRRYDNALRQLGLCLPLCDAVLIFDNSGDGARLMFDISQGMIAPHHVSFERALDRRIAEAIGMRPEDD